MGIGITSANNKHTTTGTLAKNTEPRTHTSTHPHTHKIPSTAYTQACIQNYAMLYQFPPDNAECINYGMATVVAINHHKRSSSNKISKYLYNSI